MNADGAGGVDSETAVKYRYAYDEAFVGNTISIPEDAVGLTVSYFTSNDRPAFKAEWLEPVNEDTGSSPEEADR